MATYTKVYNNPYPDGWKDGKDGKTPVTADILNNQTETFESIEQYLSDNPIEQGGSGTGGTTDYNELENLPSINGTELKGNITLDIPEKISDLEDDSEFLTDIKEQPYSDLSGKPTINGVDLQGNLTVEELGLLDITESTDTTLENSKDGILKIQKIFGNTIQDGTPTPTLPIALESTVISEIRTCRKNIFKNTLTTQTLKGVTFTVNTDKSVTINGTASERFSVDLGEFCGVKGNTCMVSIGAVGSGSTFALWGKQIGTVYSTKEFTLEESGIFEANLTVFAGAVINNVTIYPMIEVGTVATEYEPYTETVVTLPEPITLNGIDDVKDYIDMRRAELVSKFKEITFDGSSDENWLVSSAVSKRYMIKLDDMKANSPALCTQFKFGESTSEVLNEFWSNGSYLQLVFNTSFSTVSEWKAHLASNPITAVYELAEPIVTPLSEANIKALNSLQTYDGVTHIFTDSPVAPYWLLEYNTTRVGTELDKINKRITDIGTTAQINYSTEEKVVGTWIDGKPLYQKTMEFPCDDLSTVQSVFSFTNEEVKNVIDAVFINSLQDQIRYVWAGLFFWSFVIGSSGISVLRSTSDANWKTCTFRITLQYTKTTDTV